MICTNYNMNINELKEKYTKAHEAYLKHKDTNGTNNIEAQFIPEALANLQKQFPNGTIITVPDCFLNYAGADFIVSIGNHLYTYDLKVCQHLQGTEVMIDAYKHDKQGNWYNALDDKLNDYFIFINADNLIIVPTNYIRKRIPPKEQCFFLTRDLYKTTMKAVIDLTGCRKLVFSRTTN